jgi:hypothetical protein
MFDFFSEQILNVMTGVATMNLVATMAQLNSQPSLVCLLGIG